MRQTLISFDLKGDFGVFKKPDVNEGLQPTYNLLHKPALLGILGAIAGLEGYRQKGEFPEYYRTLSQLQVGIEPLENWHDKGNFVKTVIKYTNTVGYANADGNLIVTEQTLRRPAYRCYLLLDLDDAVQQRLYERIRAGEADYLPYFGKNECAVWWDADEVQEYTFEPFVATRDFQVRSVFVRKGSVKEGKAELDFDIDLGKMINAATYISFERAPIKFFVGDPPETRQMKFVQYDLAEFAFTDCTFRSNAQMPPLWEIKSPKEAPRIIYLF